jgi:hypothetical protein
VGNIGQSFNGSRVVVMSGRNAPDRKAPQRAEIAAGKLRLSAEQ